MMRKMYHEAKLVHADLSEYNMLYYKGRMFLIDVSQSVEHDHPNALEFLRKDCSNIRDFFGKMLSNRANVMTTRELFEFITDINVGNSEQQIDLYLDTIMEKIAERTEEDVNEVDEEVFKRVYIPRTLTEIYNYEEIKDKIESGDGTDELFYRTVTGLNMDLSGPSDRPALFEDENISLPSEEDDDSEDDDVDDDDIDEDSDGEDMGTEEDDEDDTEDPIDELRQKIINLHTMPKAERKRFVKEYNRQRRMTKTPKKEKKKREKLLKQKRKK